VVAPSKLLPRALTGASSARLAATLAFSFCGEPTASSAVQIAAVPLHRVVQRPQPVAAQVEVNAARRSEQLAPLTRCPISSSSTTTYSARPAKLIRDLVCDPICVVTRGSSYRANLAPTFFDQIIR